MILTTQNDYNIIGNIEQKVYINNVERNDVYSENIYKSTGLSNGYCSLKRFDNVFDTELYNENDHVEIIIKIGDEWITDFIGYITEVNAGLSESERQTSYNCMDYRSKLNDSYVADDYCYMDTITNQKINNYDSRQIISDIFANYEGFQRFTQEEPYVMELDANSFPKVEILKPLMLKGTGCGDAIEQVLQSIDKCYQLKIEYTEGKTILSCFNVFAGIKDQSFLYVNNPKYYEDDDYMLTQASKNYNFLDAVSQTDAEGDNIIIQNNLNLVESWSNISTDLIEKILEYPERYTKKEISTNDIFDEDKKISNPDYKKEYEDVYRKWKINPIDDIYDVTIEGPLYTIQSEFGQEKRQIPIESTLLQLKTECIFSGVGTFNGAGKFDGSGYFSGSGEFTGEIEYDWKNEIVEINASGYLNCNSSFSGSGTFDGADSEQYHKPFIVYQKQDDIDNQEEIYYVQEDGFSINNNLTVEFNEPFIEKKSLVTCSTSKFYFTDYENETTTCVIPDYYDASIVDENSYLVLSEYFISYPILNVVADETGLIITADGNLEDCGVDLGDGLKPFADACIMRQSPVYDTGTGYGDQNIYYTQTNYDTDILTGMYLITSAVDYPGDLISPRYDSTIKKYKIISNAGTEITVAEGTSLNTDGEYYYICNQELFEKIPFVNMKLVAAYPSLQKLTNYGTDPNTCRIKKNQLIQNDIFKKKKIKEGCFWRADENLAIKTIEEKIIQDDTDKLIEWSNAENNNKNNPKIQITYTSIYDLTPKIGDKIIENEIDTGATIVGIRHDMIGRTTTIEGITRQ